MGNQSTTYTINFKAQYDSLDKLEKQLQGISKKSKDLDLTGKEQEKVQSLLLKIQQLKKEVEDKGGDDYILDLEQFQSLEKEFNKLINKANNFSDALIKLLPPDFQEKVAKLKNEIAELNKQNQALGRMKGRSTSKKNIAVDQQALISSSEFNATDASGNIITSYNQLEQAALEIKELNGELTAQQKAILQAYEDASPKIVAIIEEYEQAWKEANDKIQSNRAALKQLSSELEATEAESINSAPTMSEASREAYTGYGRAVRDLSEGLSDASKQAQEYNKEAKKTGAEHSANTKSTNKNTDALKKNETTLGKAVKNVVSYGTALNLVRRIYGTLISTITDMDKALTNMTVVTQLSRKQAWQLTGTLQDLAKTTGMTTTEVANMTTMYLQQGQSLSEALELTEAAAKAARIAGISGSESINLLTNAMNGFQLKASKAMEVSDKFAALAAAAATDYEELATALSKVAAQANLAGMSMDFTLGLLTKGIEVTREAPETIGTALKTVISRMRELTDYGETLEDGVDVNRVETALKNIGVQLRDTNGEFRDLDDVLAEVGTKWDDLNKNQQANVAVALAGTRQQSRLIAMMQDFDRTQELVNISMNSAGATAAQHRKYMEGLEAATTNLTTSYQGLITSFTNSDIAINVINGIAASLEFLGDNIGIVYAAMGGILALYTPLLVNKLADNTATAVANFLSLIRYNTIKKEQEALTEENKAQLKGLAGLKQSIAAKFLEITGIELSTVLRKKETQAIEQQTTAELQHTAAVLTNPYVWLVAIIVALVAAWWALNKETEEGIKFQNMLIDLFKTLGRIIFDLFSIIGSLISILMPFVDFFLDSIISPVRILVSLLQMVFSIVEMIITAIDALLSPLKQLGGLSDDLDWLLKFFNGSWLADGFDWVANKLKNWAKQLSIFFETTEEKSKRYAEEIADNQEKIYDAKQKKNTLVPLLNEYDKLSKKTNKTTEDLERLKEIESEIGDVDEKYKNKDGSIKWELVRDETNEADQLIKQLQQENLDKAMKGISTGVYQEEFKNAVSDFYVDSIDASEDAAAQIAGNFQLAMQNISEEDFMSMNSEDFENMFNSVKEFEQEIYRLANDSDENTLLNQFTAFEKSLEKVPEEAQDAFKSVYGLYSEYATLINDLGLQGKEKTNFLTNMEKLGITDEEYSNLMENYLETHIGSSEADFRKWLGNVLKQDNLTKADIINQLMSGQSQEMKNAIEDATVFSNQEISENYIKSISKADNLTDLSKKAAKGELTVDELRKLQEENPNIFKDEVLYAKFIAGEYTAEDIRAEANKKALEDLELRYLFADEAERRLINTQIDAIKYAEIYSTEIWKTTVAMTAAQKQQIRLNNQLNKIQKERSQLNKADKNYHINKLNLLKQEMAIAKQQYNDAQNLLNSEEYKKLQQMGYEYIDGQWVVDDVEQVKSKYGSDEIQEILKWADANSENIKEAQEIADNWEETQENIFNEYRSIIEEEYNNQKEVLEQRKEQYEEYWNKLDEIESEQERAQSREDILSQLSSVAGGSDAASNSLRKELLSQLEDLNKEEAEARKQAARDALTESIEDHVAKIDEKLDALEHLSGEEILALLSSFGYDTSDLRVVYDNDGSGHGSIVDNNNEIVKRFKNGGLVDYTGPAWVDGTKSNPEAFLSATDTKLIQQLISALDYGSLRSIFHDREVNETTQVVIENVNITTNELNTEQDFRTSGQIFAAEFNKAIKQRGINRNVKK